MTDALSVPPETAAPVETVDAIVVGAGVVGLAVARALALEGREVLILEAEDAFGTITSARNSEVIHAGVYYAEGSLKARLCVEGRDKLYAFCRSHGITHIGCGKLIVATKEGGETEIARLKAVQARAKAAGVELVWLRAAEARTMEPDLRCVAALHSPQTGIIDSHGYMLALLGDAQAKGAALALNTPVLGGRAVDGGVELTTGGADPLTLRARTVVNAAGHGAQPLARALAGLDPATIPPQYFCKGSYFSLSGRPPFERLIYPTPGEASLGLHYTRDLGGRGRFGPDAEWIDEGTVTSPHFDYTVNPAGALGFIEAIQRYWPGLSADRLSPDYAGMRPKIQAPGEAAKDFLFQTSTRTGVNGYFALYGIESPGLTSSLAIADLVAEGVRAAS
ncbi:MAG: NAD(P)/FAD-dependent oxidoreductase [Rhodospirillum sp.]|nr:NAD(P)/FAD-dependent oxidoreductase [Rhodospirillum sp.]MCF8488120.1 NAD(P)/FAD-dependent oxidoreductase [Rhodospirillum sp.]MCF8499988.1 NAD(P)/FAD-dependent oxidoreductase [Rhodospirillum sp.]